MQGNEQIYECLQRNIDYHHTYDKSQYALDKEQIKPYKDLLSAIESEDFVVRSNHQLYKITSIQFTDISDYEKRREEMLQQCVSLIRNIIEERGIEGVFELARLSIKRAEIARSLIQIDHQYTHEIYRNFIANTLPIEFVHFYFFCLYYAIGVENYLGVVDSLLPLSKEHIAIVLSAPPLNTELIKCAESFRRANKLLIFGETLTLDVLSENDHPIITKHIREIKEHKDILELMANRNTSAAFCAEEKVSLLIELVQDGNWDQMKEKAHYIASLLKTIDLPSEQKLRKAILHLELIIYKELMKNTSDMTLHLDKEVLSSPELMIELIRLLYSTDRDQDTSTQFDVCRLDLFSISHSPPGTSTWSNCRL